jgi:glycosyltransferase involved in cell wall biosynthesis
LPIENIYEKSLMVSIDIVVPVYKPGPYFLQTLSGLATQKVNNSIVYKVIVVDDGNCDKRFSKLICEFPTIHLLTLAENVGRSKARNAGANYGKGDFILFLDADCEPENNDLINEHCKVFMQGFDVSFGTIKPQAKSGVFWCGYLNEVENKRRESANKNLFLALTSGHFAIKRKVFEECGGFDERYRHYGFEDRDLIATLIKKNAKMYYSPELIVRHDVEMTLAGVCKKMEEAGQYTSRIFANKFPGIYKTMVFSHFDLREHPILLKMPSLFLFAILPPLIKSFDKILLVEWIPKWLSHFGVKIFSSLAFLKGTSKS